MMNGEFRFDDLASDGDLLGRVERGLGLDRALAPVAVLLRAAVDELEPLTQKPEPAFLADLVWAVTAGGAALEQTGDELARRRRRRIASIALAAGALGFGVTGAAAANGSLPDSVQEFVHDVGAAVGFDLPAGSQDGPGHGRSDEAPGRPEVPGQPTTPGRSDEAPGRPDDPGNGNGVGPEGVPPGQDGTIPGQGGGPDEIPPGQGGTVPGTDEPSGRPADPGQGNGNSGDPPGVTPPGRANGD
jgi:hypothetical protein